MIQITNKCFTFSLINIFFLTFSSYHLIQSSEFPNVSVNFKGTNKQLSLTVKNNNNNRQADVTIDHNGVRISANEETSFSTRVRNGVNTLISNVQSTLHSSSSSSNSSHYAASTHVPYQPSSSSGSSFSSYDDSSEENDDDDYSSSSSSSNSDDDSSEEEEDDSDSDETDNTKNYTNVQKLEGVRARNIYMSQQGNNNYQKVKNVHSSGSFTMTQRGSHNRQVLNSNKSYYGQTARPSWNFSWPNKQSFKKLHAQLRKKFYKTYNNITSNKPFMNVAEGATALASTLFLTQSLSKNPLETLAHGAGFCILGFGYYTMKEPTPEIIKDTLNNVFGKHTSSHFKHTFKQQPEWLKFSIFFGGLSLLTYMVYHQPQKMLKNMIAWSFLFGATMHMYNRNSETINKAFTQLFKTKKQKRTYRRKNKDY